MSPGDPPKPPGGRFVSRGRSDDMWGSWRKLFRYMSNYRISFVIALFAAVLNAILAVMAPSVLSEMTDAIEVGLRSDIDMGLVTGLAVTLVMIYAACGLFAFLDQYCMATVSQRTASRFRRDIAKKINRLPLRYFDGHRTGDILSRITNDVDNIGQSMHQGVTSLLSSLTLVSGATVMMFVTDYRLAVVSLSLTAAGLLVMKALISYSQRYYSAQQRDLGRMNTHVDEMYSGHEIVKAFGGEEDSLAMFREINSELDRSAFRSQFIGRIIMPVVNFSENIGYVAVCICGALMYMDGSITFGTIVAFMFYISMISHPLSQMSESLISMQSVAASADRVFELIEEDEMDPEPVGDSRIGDVRGRVEFRNVCFGYDPGKDVIHDFSLTVEPGQKVAIVGPTGAGKTTIVNLLMRFYDVSGGEITVDGVSTKDLTRKDIRSMFGMVLQDSWIFDGTIRENIAYCMEGVTDEDLDRVCGASGLSHLIDTLPNGYDTHMGASELSAGQRQQITIARAMIQDRPMLILDEATSSVDTRTEKTIQRAMDTMMEGRTSFIIAHRLSTIRNADLILVMKDGSICEQGTHDQLMERNGYYKDLYDSQFSD